MHDSSVSVLEELVEALVDQSVQVVEVLDHLVLWGSWLDEFHGVDLSNYILLASEGLLNNGHRDLLVSLGGLSDDTLAVLVELDNGLHHTDSLVEWAIVVVLGERVLLQELILDDLGSL